MIQDLFTEICKRGCLIEAKSDYPIDHLPKCLVKVNDNLIDPYHLTQADFMIQSMISESIHLHFVKHSEEMHIINDKNIMVDYYKSLIKPGKWGWDTIILCQSNDLALAPRGSKPLSYFHKKNMEQLDLLTHYLYTNSFIQPSSDILASYKKNVRTTMISNFINDEGLFEFLRRIDYTLLIPKEIKLFIMILFMKLDNWDNVGVHMNIFLN